jgi:hypothetical protein
MQANNKSLIIIVCIALVAAFFMPWINFFIKISAWDMIFGDYSEFDSSSLKYIVLLIPISAILIVSGAASNKENYIISTRLLFKIPVVSLGIVILAILLSLNEDGERVRVSDLGDIFQVLGIGFWITLIASVALPFLHSQQQPASTDVPVQKPAQKTDYSRMSKTGIAIAALGLVLMLISTQNRFFSKTQRYRVDPGAYGLPAAYDPMGAMYDTRRVFDKKKKNAVFVAGIAALIFGGLIFVAGRSSTSSTPTGAGPTPAVNPRPQININLPKVNWDNVSRKTKSFIVRYRVIVLSSIGLLIALIIVYNLFIKTDPVGDGKRLAKNYCSCAEERNKNNLTSMNTFHEQFDNKKFKGRAEARNALNALVQENQSKYESCTQAANIKFNERLADYQSKGGKNLYSFQQAYGTITNACNNPSNSEVVVLQGRINEKIKAIVDADPDIDRVKNDLVGRQILGWTFRYLNEFRTAQILNTSKSSDRIDYLVKLNIVGNTGDEHDCEAMISYVQTDYGWIFNSVNANYITYVNTFYPDRLVQITPFQNCKWSAENTYKMSWKTSNWDYAEETVTGPDKGPTTLPYSTTYFIRSLESQTIQVKFTYWPNN